MGDSSGEEGLGNGIYARGVVVEAVARSERLREAALAIRFPRFANVRLAPRGVIRFWLSVATDDPLHEPIDQCLSLRIISYSLGTPLVGQQDVGTRGLSCLKGLPRQERKAYSPSSTPPGFLGC